MIEGERTYSYAWRPWHALRMIASSLAVVCVNGYYLSTAHTIIGYVIPSVIGGFFVFMTLVMAVGLTRRSRRLRVVTVGERALSAPSKPPVTSPVVEIAYADMTEVTLLHGSNAGLRVRYRDQVIEIPRILIHSDAEFDEMAILVKQRARAASASLAP
jgi:hypothetical protein